MFKFSWKVFAILGRKLKIPGPYLHLQRGLLVPEDQNMDLELGFLTDNGMTEDQLASEIIGLIWPTTTALTLISPPFVNAKSSSFHQERLKIAGGKHFSMLILNEHISKNVD
jgi:hypothetical protein